MASAKPKKPQDNRMVHWLIKDVAQSLAGAYYELAASTGKHCNEFYKAFPNQKKFIRKEWPRFIHYARQTMVQQLMDGSLSDAQKLDISDALCLDATLPYSTQETQITDFRH